MKDTLDVSVIVVPLSEMREPGHRKIPGHTPVEKGVPGVEAVAFTYSSIA